MNVVLVEPEIAPNVGNVARLCAATHSILHLIEPFGFQLDDRQLKRAGMDYWEMLEWKRWAHWSDFRNAVPPQSKLWWIESGGPRHYAEVKYGPNDFLVFGRESAGLPLVWLNDDPDHWVRIPQLNPKARSLNVSNCVAIVLYESLRQHHFHLP